MHNRQETVPATTTTRQTTNLACHANSRGRERTSKKRAAAVLDKPNSRMSGFGDRLVEEDIWAIIAFMKKHWQEIEVAADR